MSFGHILSVPELTPRAAGAQGPAGRPLRSTSSQWYAGPPMSWSRPCALPLGPDPAEAPVPFTRTWGP